MLGSLALAVLADGIAGLVGGLLPESVIVRQLKLLVGFAAGALIAAFFLDLVPEAHRALGESCWAWGLGGYLLMAVGQRFLEPHAEGHTRGPVEPSLLLAADALHNLGDGVALAAAFVMSTQAGWGMTLAVLFHELPHEVGDYAILRAAGWAKAKALVGLVLVQLCSGLGAMLLLLLRHTSEHVAAVALAIAAGSFLHIGATNLVPHLLKGDRRERTQGGVGFAVGAALVFGLMRA